MADSIRNYAILIVGAGKTSSGGAALGGSALLATAQHKLDGVEHLAADDTTRLDASVDAHGLMPKLPGDASLVYDGSGAFRAEASTGGFVPTYVEPAAVFVVPDNRQALFTLPIVLGAGAGISIGLNSALVEVH